MLADKRAAFASGDSGKRGTPVELEPAVREDSDIIPADERLASGISLVSV
jgi:hypothetical protein